MKNVTIYLESNPNPKTLKFVANSILLEEGVSVDFPSPTEAQKSALAQELFMYPFVQRVFFSANFVTVTKNDEVSWYEIQDTLRNHIKKFLESGKALMEPDMKPGEGKEIKEESETVRKIKDILEEYIRPAVEQDGGAITFHSYKEKTVWVQLQGACSGCPSATTTLKLGIENLFHKLMPEEVEHVVDVQ